MQLNIITSLNIITISKILWMQILTKNSLEVVIHSIIEFVEFGH